MFCQFCGFEMPDNTLICPNCSTPVWQQTPNFRSPAAVNPYANDPQASADAAPVLTWGILGLAFSCSFFLSFLGIVFSAIGRSKANAYIAKYGMVFGKSKVGSIFSKIGLIVGIVSTVLLILYIILIVYYLDEYSSIGYWY